MQIRDVSGVIEKAHVVHARSSSASCVSPTKLAGAGPVVDADGNAAPAPFSNKAASNLPTLRSVEAMTKSDNRRSRSGRRQQQSLVRAPGR